MIGQEKLRNHFTTLLGSGTLPRAMMLVGAKGQGKRTLARWVATEAGWGLYELPDYKVENIRDAIQHGQRVDGRCIYLMPDMQDLTPGAANAMLKFLEEPPRNAYLILTITNPGLTLPTIVSRCALYTLESYQPDELAQFTEDPVLLDMCANPGQVQELKAIEYKSLIDFANKVISNITKVSAANAFKVLAHVAEEQYPIFLTMLEHVIYERMRQAENVPELVGLMMVLSKYRRQVENKSVNTANALEMMLLEMREVQPDGLPSLKEGIR